MSWLGKLWGERIGRKIGEQVAEEAMQAVKNGKFDSAIEDVIVRTTRDGPDEGLSRIGFILKITVELIDRSVPPLPYKRARDMAEEVYQQFRRDNDGVKFGDPDWDWSGSAARTLAEEYEIDHWEPAE